MGPPQETGRRRLRRESGLRNACASGEHCVALGRAWVEDARSDYTLGGRNVAAGAISFSKLESREGFTRGRREHGDAVGSGGEGDESSEDVWVADVVSGSAETGVDQDDTNI
jgi:hypothetical protein